MSSLVVGRSACSRRTSTPRLLGATTPKPDGAPTVDEQAPPAAGAAVVARIEASFHRQGLMRLLGAQLAHVAPRWVQINVAGRDELSQQHGLVHAGVTSAIADTAGGYAAMTLLPATSEVLTVEYKLNLLAPAAAARLEAVGTVLKSGRTLSVCQLAVYGIGSNGRKLIAAGQQTMIGVSEDTRL